jgi:hypothetical protein
VFFDIGHDGESVLRRDWRGKGETGSAQAIGTTAEEGEEAEIPEDLELLADFVTDVEGILQRNMVRRFHEHRC